MGIVIGDGEGAFDDLGEGSWKPRKLREELWGEWEILLKPRELLGWRETDMVVHFSLPYHTLKNDHTTCSLDYVSGGRYTLKLSTVVYITIRTI